MSLENLIVTEQRLGKGGFGTVSVGELGGGNVAAKELSQSEKEVDNLTREASKLKTLRYGKHITYIYGITSKDENLYMVMEYCKQGDLRNYLERNKESVTYEQKILFCRGILLGLLYCHSMKVFHGDIKCSNVLLGRNLEPKLTDFGLSMTVDNIEYYSKLYDGSLYWVAPELFSIKDDEMMYQEFIADPYPCDVYSLGATFCQVSYDGATDFIDSDDPEMDIMLGIVSPTPKDAFLEEIVNYCCQFNRNERISLESCFDMLEKVTEKQLSEPANKGGYSFFPTAKNRWKQIQKKIKAKSTQTLPPSFILRRPAKDLVVGLSDLSLLEWLCINDCADAVEYMVKLHNPDEKQIQWLYGISKLCRSSNAARLFQKKVNNHKDLDLSRLMDNNPQQFIKALIKAGAVYDYDLLKKAIEEHYSQIVQILVNQNAYSDKLIIHYAIECRNIEAVKILATDARLEAINKDGDTPLLAAIDIENVEIMKILLDNNADVHSGSGPNQSNIKIESYYIPLYRAAVKGNHEIIELLINAGARIDTEGSEWYSLVQDLEQRGKSSIIQFISDEMKKKREKTEYTPLCTVIQNRQSNIVQRLIDDGTDPNEQSYDQYSPLHWAVITGDEKIIKVLFKAGADINAKNPDAKWPKYPPTSLNYFNEYTPLHIAIAKRHLKIVQLLIEFGADFSIKNGLEQTITDIANKGDLKEIETIIRNHSPANSESLQRTVELMSAETVGAISMEVVKSMINRYQADTDTISGCLCIVASYGNIEAVNYFMECGADVNKPFNGRTPLEAAVSGGYVQIAQVLIDAGANVNVKSVTGETPLFRCVISLLVDMVQLLIENGADINARDDKGFAPLHFVENREIMQILVNAGADVNTKNKFGETPLHQYVKESQTEMVQFLVDKGADVNVRDKNGHAPIYSTKSAEMMLILINAGADVNTKNIFGETLLYQYVKEAQTEMVQFLIDKDADVNVRDKNGHAPIHCAKSTEIVQILINAGADVNIKNIFGETPLHWHASGTHTEIVQFLVNKGADVNARGKNNYTPIYYAKSTEVMQIFTNAGADINTKSMLGETLLHQYVKKAQAEIVQFLVNKGADINVKDKDGYAPIFYAESTEIVQILINAGADVNTKNRIGENLLHCYVKEAQTEMVQFLADKGVDINARDMFDCVPIHYAKNTEIAEIFVNAGADINAKNAFGETLLHQYVKESQTEMVQFLVDKSANVNTKDKDGYAPIFYAESIEMIQILINAGADINIKNIFRETLLHQYVKKAQTEVVQFLVDKGADVNVRDKNGHAPIYNTKSTEIGQILINAGADVNTKNIFGETLLHQYIKEAQTEKVQLLIDKDADVDARDKNGHAPIHCAKSTEIVQILINAGADINAKNKFGETLLHWHASGTHTEIVQFLVNKGADVNARGKNNYTPIYYAKSTEVMQIFINAGTDVNTKSMLGETLLHQYVKEAQTEIVQLLIDNDADVNVKDKGSCTPIHYVKSTEIAEILINAGADINVKNESGKTLFNILLEEQNKNLGNAKYQRKKDCELGWHSSVGRTPPP